MAADVPEVEPTTIRAGTTLKFTRDYPDYPASSWTLTYHLLSDTEAPIDFTATASVDTFSITVPYTTTATWTSGDYWMVGYVTDATEKHIVYQNWVAVEPDYSAEIAYDARTWEERLRDDLISDLGTKGTNEIASYSINGRSVTMRSHEERWRWLEWIEGRIAGKARMPMILAREVPAL